MVWRLLATLCSAAGFLFAQVPSAIHVRSESFRSQDAEYQLSEAFVNGSRVTFAGDPAPTISFHSGGVISGYAGVNQYFAKIKIAPDGGLRLETPGFALTKLTGDPQRMVAEAAFLSALEAAGFIHFDGGVTLESADHTTRILFTRTTAIQQLSEVLNMELVLVRFVSNGKEITLPAGVSITLTFRSGGQFSGRSAVNNYAGVFTTTPDGKINLQPPTATQLAGPADLMALERAYFDALPLVRQVRINGDRIILENETTTLEFAIVRTPR
jgi:heat shock protein HslJ